MFSKWLGRLFILAGVALTACQPATPEPAALHLQDAWVRAPLPGRTMTAGYLQIANAHDQTRVINAVRSAQFERVEMHETKMVDGTMQMRQVETLSIPAGDSVSLAPGGMHLMLIGAQAAIAEGESVTVTFTVDDGSQIDLTMTVSKENPHE